MLGETHAGCMRGPDTPEEHLRRALLELQDANRRYVAGFGRPAEAESAAQAADEARAEAARWGALARAASTLRGDDAR